MIPSAADSRITLLAAVASNGVVGADGDLPWRIPEDFAFFKRMTMGHPMVMGRATFDSIGQPLPGRRSIVITRERNWRHDGVEVAGSMPVALELAAGGRGGDEVFVIGGGQIYRLAMPFADRLLITEVDLEPEGDVTFPRIDPFDWVEVGRVPGSGVEPSYAFVEYRRRG